ncbi:hypothetical protein, partial [Pseudomonas coronafaciens]|uniref:hypothetical protein n=1 Tax=Pseudomonas coronafaciens TaxID=53409 RepID=UPI001F3C213A
MLINIDLSYGDFWPFLPVFSEQWVPRTNPHQKCTNSKMGTIDIREHEGSYRLSCAGKYQSRRSASLSGNPNLRPQ